MKDVFRVVHHRRLQLAGTVCDDVSLAAFDPFPCVITARPATLRGLDGTAVDETVIPLLGPIRDDAAPGNQCLVDQLEEAVVAPDSGISGNDAGRCASASNWHRASIPSYRQVECNVRGRCHGVFATPSLHWRSCFGCATWGFFSGSADTGASGTWCSLSAIGVRIEYAALGVRCREAVMP
jgi:hypothetical protein